jgi:hypothetical protein
METIKGTIEAVVTVSMGILSVILIIGLVGLIMLIPVALGIDFYKTVNNGIGWISQDRNSTAVKKIIKEEGGCVYFVDVWGSDGKTCGSYEIKRYQK